MTHFTSPIAASLADDLLERFQRYVRIDTESAPGRTRSPSTPGQLVLAKLLVEELEQIGLADVSLDANGYVFATLPGSDPDAPAIGLLAHLDTSPDVTGNGVEPIVHRDYDGGVIALPRGGVVLDPASMPALVTRTGHDIVTASGDTLLGADDKAGMAEIMAAVAYLAAHPELPRATLRIGFTPDEEIGEGATLFDIERFGARRAYTLDGSEVGELQDESFTAAAITLTITGVDIHPGTAKGKLVNAARIAGEILAALPSDRLTPETTEDREGFIHPVVIDATAPKATVELIARDFEDDLLADHVALVRSTAEEVVARHPGARLAVDVQAQYPNMRDHLAPFPEIVTVAEEAIRAEGLAVIRTPIRGGTDGSRLSAMGLPTPNLFTGGHEYHSVREWASAQDMASAAAVIVRLAGLWAERR